jgi:Tfp pilus assembly protein PilX
MTSRLLRDERGVALATAIVLMTIMLGTAIAVLSLVDGQGRASGVQREGDSAFNLADAALSSAAFALSRTWPEAPAPDRAWTQAATCGAQAIGGGVGATDDTSLAGRIQQRLHEVWQARGGTSDATWDVKVCDAGSAPAWTDALLSRPAYDATGPRTVTAPDGSTFTARRLWVRARAVVDGERRAVASLVQVQERAALPAGYAAVTGRMAFADGANASVNGLLTAPTLGPLVGQLLQSRSLVDGGQIGVRCGLLTDLCPESAAAALHEIPLAANLGLTNGQVTQFGSPSAASPEALRLLRERAVRAGTYVSGTSDGASCLPAGVALNADSVVFVEKVGDGFGVCKVQAPATVGTLVVATGRIEVVTTATAGLPAIVRGVLYAANGQGSRTSDVVALRRGVQVLGAVYVDGGGRLALPAPEPTTAQLLDSLCGGLLSLVCPVLRPTLSLLGADQLVDALLNGRCWTILLVRTCLPRLTPAQVLLAAMTNQSAAIRFDAGAVARVKVFGSSGTVQGTTAQVPAGGL